MADLKALLNRITKEYAEEIIEHYRSIRALEVGSPPLQDLDEARLDAFYWAWDEKDRMEGSDFSEVESDLDRLLGGLKLFPPDRKRALYELQRTRVRAASQVLDEYENDYGGSPRPEEVEVPPAPTGAPLRRRQPYP